MKIIISAGNKKREIIGSFSVCGSLADLTLLRDELSSVIDRDRPFTFGWVDVIPNRPRVLANTPAEPWGDGCSGDQQT